MKILLIHTHSIARHKLTSFLEEQGHAVVAEETLEQILYHLGNHRPHLVLIEAQPIAFQQAIEKVLEDFSLNIPFRWLPGNLDYVRSVGWLQSAIANVKPVLPHQRQLYTSEQRLVLHDKDYLPYAGATKQNIPEVFSETELEKEQNILIRQIECALKNHSVAQTYLNQLLVTDHGLQNEVAYRAVHSSYKIYWLRDHTFRWAAVLAHYLPVEIEHLPPPAPLSPFLDFLAYEPSVESLYVVSALLSHGFKPSWRDSFRALLLKKFVGQTPEELHQEILELWGWSSLLKHLALAQVRVMDAILNSKSDWYREEMPSRRLHRAFGTYLDFWHLRHLRRNPHLLGVLADQVVQEGLRTPAAPTLVPPFHQFLSAARLANPENKKSI